MENLLTLELEAHSREQNHHRRYEIRVGRDLLNDWIVAVRFGRVGHGGREQRFAAGQAEELQAIVRQRLRRRLSAPTRIGCAYRLVALRTAPEFDASSWLPSDLIARLFAA